MPAPSRDSQAPYLRVGAYALLVDADRILLVRISPQVSNAGLWTLPGGGLDFGEPPVDGMTREVREETGLVVESAGLVHVDSIHETTPRPFHGVRILYSATVLGGELTHEVGGSTDRCQWWRRDDLDPALLDGLAQVGIAHAFGEARR